MVELLKNTHALLGEGSADDYGKLVALTYTFCWFGKIHPSWTATVTFSVRSLLRWQRTFGYALSPRFAINPRPFDRLLALALEIFTRAPAGKENEELGLVAEYLAFRPGTSRGREFQVHFGATMFKVCRSHFGTDAQHLQRGIVPTNVAYYTSR